MNIGEYSVRNPVNAWLLVVIMIGGGILAFQSMGKLEDPPFTIKSAKILTPYPGATAKEEHGPGLVRSPSTSSSSSSIPW